MKSFVEVSHFTPGAEKAEHTICFSIFFSNDYASVSLYSRDEKIIKTLPVKTILYIVARSEPEDQEPVIDQEDS